MYSIRFFNQDGKHLDVYDHDYIMNKAGAEQAIENFRECYSELADASAQIIEYKYVRVSMEPDPFDMQCGDCEVHFITRYYPITDEQLHEMHRYYIEADRHMPEWQIDEWEVGTDEPYSPAPENYDEFIQQMLDLGEIEVA